METADGKEYWNLMKDKPKQEPFVSDSRDIRAMLPKMFATDGSEKAMIL